MEPMPENLHEPKGIDHYPMYIVLTKFQKNSARFDFTIERNPFFQSGLQYGASDMPEENLHEPKEID